jgi:hypothetical protein
MTDGNILKPNIPLEFAELFKPNSLHNIMYLILYFIAVFHSRKDCLRILMAYNHDIKKL